MTAALPSRTDAEEAARAGAVMAAIVVIYGLGPPVMKAISAPPLVAASARSVIAVPVMWAVAHVAGRRISRAMLRKTAVAGLLSGANLVLVFAALPHISIAVLSVILALQPGVVLLVAGPWLGERATPWHVAWTGVGVLGVVIVVLGGNPSIRGDALGFLLSSAALMTYTAYYLINRRVRFTTAIDPLEWMVGVTLFSSVAIAPFALASSMTEYSELGGADWAYLGFVIVVLGVVGHTMMSWAHRFIPATRSSLYLLGMNVVAVLVAWPMHDEPVTLILAAGGAVVLAAGAAVVSRPAAVRVSGS